MKRLLEYKSELGKYLNINILCQHIEKGFEDFINKKPDGKQEEKIISLLKLYKESSTSGSPQARNIIKSHIKTNLLTAFDIYQTDTEGNLEDTILFQGIRIEEDNDLIDMIIPFDKIEELTAEEKLAVLLHVNRTTEKNGRNGAFKILLSKYGSSAKVRYADEYQSLRYELDFRDIDRIYEVENIRLCFAEKIEIVVQFVYQRVFGLMCLDLLAYSDVNEVGFANDGAYIYCWCEKKIWLSFLKLSSDEARVVQDRAISFDKSVGQLDRNNPEKLCHRADGARITVTQPPYFSSRNLCIRIFNQNHATYKELEDSYRLRLLTTALIKTGESICLQGGLGTGKTTKMEAMFEILDDCLHIGTVEDYFEQHIMQKYPYKRIVEAQSINDKSLLDSVKTLLRMSVDVADLGEVRDGSALFAFIQLVQSVSVAAWFTTHIVNPETTVPRLKNMLMGTGRYLTEQSAIMDIIHYVNVIFQHDIIDGKRIISKVVEIVPMVAASFNDAAAIDSNTSLEDLQRLFYLQQIKTFPSNMYKLNTILDTVEGKPKFINYPSERMQRRAFCSHISKAYMDKLLEVVKKDIEGKG